jgi:hypothetical protein
VIISARRRAHMLRGLATTWYMLRGFLEKRRGAFLGEKEGALHEGLSKTLESLRRSLRLV